jgi:hypothetical protein
MTEEQQKKLEELQKRMSILVNEIPGYERYTQQAKVLSKLDTRGKKPDYSKLSDQEVRDIFDVGRNNATINGLADVSLEHKYGSLHLTEKGITSSRGPDSKPKGPDVPASREYMLDAIDTWLQHDNYALNPRELVQAQLQVASSPGVILGGKLDKAKMEYSELRESIELTTSEKFRDPLIDENIRKLKEAEQRFGVEEQRLKTESPQRAARSGIEFAAQMNFSAKQVAFEIGEIKYLDKNSQMDLSGTNIEGLDLSESDLTGIKIDAKTLSRAKGLDTVRGVDAETLKGALALPGLEKEQARLQKKADDLQKPWSFERFKAFFKKGGAEKELQETAAKLAEAKTAVLKVGSPATYENLQKGEAAQLLKETLKSPSLSEGFKKFAGKQGFGAEMSFLDEVESLKQDARRGADLTDLKVRAFGIQQRYLSSGAEQRIDVDFDVRDKVNEVMEGFDDLDHDKIQNLFTPAQKEVQNNLANGPMQRFRQTEEFQMSKLGESSGRSVRHDYKPSKAPQLAGNGNSMKI